MTNGEDVTLGYRVRVADEVVFRAMATETVLLDLRSGRYFGLNTTAGRMLQLLSDHGDADEVVTAMAEETGQPTEVIARDLDELCTTLSERGLVEVDADR